MKLRIESVEADGRVLLQVTGSLDAYGGPQLREVLARIAIRKPAMVEVNLMGIDYLDSFGTGELLEGIRAIEAQGGDVSVPLADHMGRPLLRLGLGEPLHLVLKPTLVPAGV